MTTPSSYIYFTQTPSEKLLEIIMALNPDKTAVLVDENTYKHCLPMIACGLDFFVITIKSGEKHKNIQTCENLWKKLTDLQFSRKSLLINLGGGVIGDMGGFVAATYKRGIQFINIPTSLLAQVDASLGGKLGVDFHGLKNHIGIFQNPKAVILWSGFLKTLPSRELQSGYAETIKHGLIWDKVYCTKIMNFSFPDKVDWDYLLKRSVEIKNEIVSKDPYENGLRKILNFGHTLGHALETWLMNDNQSILHGEAIAAGMIMETKLATMLNMLAEHKSDKLINYLLSIYGKLKVLPPNQALFDLLAQDKKNKAGNISFSLIDDWGNCQWDVTVPSDYINRALEYYQRLKIE